MKIGILRICVQTDQNQRITRIAFYKPYSICRNACGIHGKAALAGEDLPISLT